MNLKKTSKAKEIFLLYRGSHFHMKQEGDYDYYKKLNISRDTEYTWLKELQAEILYKLHQTSNNKTKAELFSEYGELIVQLKDLEGYQFMLTYTKENAGIFDSNTMSRIINTILNTLGIIKNDAQKTKIINECLLLLKDVLKKPINASKDYQEDGKLPDYLSDEKIALDIENTIKYWESHKV